MYAAKCSPLNTLQSEVTSRLDPSDCHQNRLDGTTTQHTQHTIYAVPNHVTAENCGVNRVQVERVMRTPDRKKNAPGVHARERERETHTHTQDRNLKEKELILLSDSEKKCAKLSGEIRYILIFHGIGCTSSFTISATPA